MPQTFLSRSRAGVPYPAIALLIVALALFALVACGDDDDDDAGETGDEDTTTETTATDEATSDATGDASAAATEAATEDASATGEADGDTAAAFPVTIEHKYGSTTIESEPQRIVSIGYQDQDYLYALGVQPIAARYWYGPEDDVIYPWAERVVGDIPQPEILNMNELDIEAIAALNPDLIIGVYSGITEDEFNTLSVIAPTVTQPGDYVDYGTPWQEQLLITGRAVGREAEAEAIIADIEGQFAAIAEAHPEWAGKRVAVASYGATDGGAGFFVSEDPRSRFFTLLGFEVSPELDDIAGDSFHGDLSGEQFNLLDGDLLVWAQLYGNPEMQQQIESNPIVQQLAVTQAGHYFFIDGVIDLAFNWNTPLAIPYALETIVPAIESAMNGEPTNVGAGTEP